MIPLGQNMPPARTAALAALEKTLPLAGKPGQDLQAALDYVLRSVSDPRDKALATELTYGFLRFKGRLEHLVTTHLSKPTKTPPRLLRIIAVAAYELIYLDNVPPHATLSWAVGFAKTLFGPAQANVVNAVLRRIQSLGEAAAAPSFYEASTRSKEQFLAIWHSCPLWLVNLWLRQYDEQIATILLHAQICKPQTGVRINVLHPEAYNLFNTFTRLASPLFSRFPWLGFEMTNSHISALLSQAEHDGLLTRQSPAVGDILTRLGYGTWPDPIWDVCAGRGGKSMALLEQGHKLFSSDTNKRRLRGLITDANRLHFAMPLAFLADGAHPPLHERPTTLLIDAPCSGLGVLSRRPDAKWKRSPADIIALASIQKRIIQASSQILPVGGFLVYMTCTMTREENDAQAASIERLGFVPVQLAEPAMTSDSREFFWGGVWRKTGVSPSSPR